MSSPERWAFELRECAMDVGSESEMLRAARNQSLYRQVNELPGHVYPQVERVVEANERYVVVAKLGAGATFAVEHDPRRHQS